MNKAEGAQVLFGHAQGRADVAGCRCHSQEMPDFVGDDTVANCLRLDAVCMS